MNIYNLNRTIPAAGREDGQFFFFLPTVTHIWYPVVQVVYFRRSHIFFPAHNMFYRNAIIFDDTEDSEIKTDDVFHGRGWKVVQEHDQRFQATLKEGELLS